VGDIYDSHNIISYHVLLAKSREENKKTKFTLRISNMKNISKGRIKFDLEWVKELYWKKIIRKNYKIEWKIR